MWYQQIPPVITQYLLQYASNISIKSKQMSELPAFCFKRHKAPSVSCIISSHKAQGTQPAMTFAIASGFYDFDDLVRLATLSLAIFLIYFSKHLNVISWPVQDDPLPASFLLPDATIIPARFAICQSLDHFATLQTRPPTSNQGKQMRRTASCKRSVHLVQLSHKFRLCFDNDKEQPEKQKILFNWQSVATGLVSCDRNDFAQFKNIFSS